MKMAEHKATLDFTKALSPVLRLRESVGSLSASGPSEADQRWQEKGLKRIPTLEWRPRVVEPGGSRGGRGGGAETRAGREERGETGERGERFPRLGSKYTLRHLAGPYHI